VSRAFTVLCVGLTALLTLFTALAMGHIFLISPLTLKHALADGSLLPVLAVSLETSAVAALLALCLGTPVAYVLARREFRGKIAVETLLDLPVALPPMVAGLALLLLVSPAGPVGRLLAEAGVTVIFTRTGIILAQFFVALPFYIRSARTAIAAIPPSIPAAAALLRAGEAYTFFHVILPLSREGIISGLVMCWTRALGEFGATAMLAGCIPGLTETLPIAIYTRATAGDLASAGAAAFALAAISFVTLMTLRTVFKPESLKRKA
jgi:molybdate transport system permease protein